MWLIENVIEHAHSGQKVLFCADQLGGVRVRIKRGPLKLRAVLYETDVQTAEVLKDQIALLAVDGRTHRGMSSDD